MRSKLTIVALGLVLAAPAFPAEGDPPASAEVTAAMKPYLDGYKLAGVIAIVADKTGKVHYKNLLGYADVEAKKPISEDNVFWIASMTKMWAGASVMMLVDEGKISLDDPVTKYIPQLKKWMVAQEKDQSHVLLKPLVRPVTVRHLLSHTSGLAGSSELQQVMGADSIPLKGRALSSVTGPLQWQPGDKYAYGTQSMNIAARIVEIVSGMPYEQFLQKRFFDPLGMKETTFWPNEAQMARLAGAYGPNKEKNGYARGGIGFLRKPLHDRAHRYPEAGGGLFSTTHDIFRYGLMLVNDGELDGKRYLSHAAMDELRKEQTGKTRVNYSLGYHLRNGMFGHDGAYGTDLSVNPKTGMVAIFMVQCTGGDQWAARDLFLKTATQIFPNFLPCSVAGVRGAESQAQADAPSAGFDGARSTWHGFDRHDYILDEATLAITSVADQARGGGKGQRRCIVVVPKSAALGKPWSWRGCYWDHEPQTEIELLRRGFHVAYIAADAQRRPDKTWEAWYAFLTEKHGLSKKPAFVGMSRGGEYAYIWATGHPSQVSCIYADNPGVNADALSKLGALAAADVPILHVCGSIDPLLGRSAGTIEHIYQEFGGRISVIIQEGKGHHPHSLRDPGPIADFISHSVQAAVSQGPAYLAGRISSSSFYGLKNAYRYYPKEGNYLTCRGPWFTDWYERYSFELKGVEGSINVIVPRKTAPGKPWTFRADHVTRDDAVDLALLAKGFHIVTGPVPYNANGPSLQSWNAVYKLLTEHGFSRRPVLEGAGGAAGEAYAWAIANPDKVSCIYAENPLLRSNMTKAQPLNNLAVLAKAGLPILHVCGSLDPLLSSQTREAEARYKKLGAALTVIIQEGMGHYPTAPKDPTPVVEFILRQQEPKGVTGQRVPATRPVASPSTMSAAKNLGRSHWGKVESLHSVAAVAT